MTGLTRSLALRLAAHALAVALCLGAVSTALAEGGPASLAPPEPPAADAPQIEHFEYWRARGDAAREKVAEARARLDAANTAVNRMQRRNHPRGEAREALRREQAEAREAWEAAVHVLEVELPAEARAARADPRWLRERS